MSESLSDSTLSTYTAADGTDCLRLQLFELNRQELFKTARASGEELLHPRKAASALCGDEGIDERMRSNRSAQTISAEAYGCTSRCSSKSLAVTAYARS